MKRTELLKNQLSDLSAAVNSFSSETVQLIVLERLFRILDPAGLRKAPRKHSATILLRQLLAVGYFDEPRSIGELAGHCSAEYECSFETNQLSGLLLAMVRSGQLERIRSPENNRYRYLTKT